MTRDKTANRRRTILAFLFAPWIVALLLTLVASLFSPGFQRGDAGVALMLALAGALYVGYLLCGMPLFLYMRARGFTRLRHFSISGLLAGNLMLMIMLAISLAGGEPVSFDLVAGVFAILVFSAIGALAAAVLWTLIYWSPVGAGRAI
jgi:hypothetical protein